MANNYTNTSNSFLKNYFEDGPGDPMREPLVYDGARFVVNTNDLGLVLGVDIQYSVSTAATSRIGSQKTRNSDLVVSRSYETSGTGGNRIGSVVLFENDAPREQVDISHFHAHRDGKNVKFMQHLVNVPKIKPLIRISPKSFYESPEGEIIDHSGNFHGYGFGKEYLTVDLNNKNELELVPFKDFSKLIPDDLIGKTSAAAYPFVHDTRNEFTQFLDPSKTGLNGAIDIFDVRRSINNSSINDFRIKGLFADLQGGDIISNQRGSTMIESHRELRSGNNATFLDSQEIEFGNYKVSAIGSAPGAAVYKFPIPGIVNDEKYMIAPFDETIDYLKAGYSFSSQTVSLEKFISGSRKSTSEIGSRFKSSTCGLVFGESNALGTDSLAFGGMKK